MRLLIKVATGRSKAEMIADLIVALIRKLILQQARNYSIWQLAGTLVIPASDLRGVAGGVG